MLIIERSSSGRDSNPESISWPLRARQVGDSPTGALMGAQSPTPGSWTTRAGFCTAARVFDWSAQQSVDRFERDATSLGV